MVSVGQVAGFSMLCLTLCCIVLRPQSQIDHFVLFGGSTRIPRVQQLLKEYMGREMLDQNLNGDEAAAFGAVFHAADLHPSFRVRQTLLTDIASYPIGMRLTDVEGAVGEDGKPFSKRVAAFRRNSPLGKKVSVAVTHPKDLAVSVFYDSPETLPLATTPALGSYHVSGVSNVTRDHITLFTEGKVPKLSLTFQLTLSGLVEFVSSDASVEEATKVPRPKPAPKKVEPKKDAKKDDKKDDAKDAKKDDDKDAKKDDDKDAKDGDKKDENKESKEESTSDTKESADEGKEETKADDSAEDKTEAAATSADTSATEAQPDWVWRNKTHRFPLTGATDPVVADVRGLSSDEKAAAKALLKQFTAFDASRRALADAKNALESFIYGTREKLTDEAVTAVSSETQRSELLASLDTAEAWLGEHSFDEDTALFREQLAPLKTTYDAIALRVKEAVARPKAVAQFTKFLAAAKKERNYIQNNMTWVDAKDVTRLSVLLEAADKWLADKQAEQNALTPQDPPAFLASAVDAQAQPIKDLADRLLRTPKPKPKVTTPPKSDAKKGDAKSDAKGDAKSDAKDQKADDKEADAKDKTEDKEEAKAEAKAEAKEDAAKKEDL